MKSASVRPQTILAGTGSRERYPLTIGFKLEKELIETIAREGNNRRVAIITDSAVKKIWGAELVATLKKTNRPVELFDFPRGERQKDQNTVTALQHALLKKRYGRDTLIVAFGGGVVGDTAGFVAATYLRGVPYVNVPTTLLAMVDSSVGGKVGIDTPYGKNTLGAFWMPRAVIMDLRYLGTLPRRSIVNGLMEAVKTSFTSDAAGVALALALDLDRPLRTLATLQKVVHSSVSIKANVTERDPREGNERRVLNFGHTIGHALELLSGYSLPHGYAVGYGILVEAKIAELLGVLPAEECREIHRILKQFGISPAVLRDYSPARILNATKGDKKTRGGVAHYVLLESIGTVYAKGGQFAHPVPDAIVRKALASAAR